MLKEVSTTVQCISAIRPVRQRDFRRRRETYTSSHHIVILTHKFFEITTTLFCAIHRRAVHSRVMCITTCRRDMWYRMNRLAAYRIWWTDCYPRVRRLFRWVSRSIGLSCTSLIVTFWFSTIGESFDIYGVGCWSTAIWGVVVISARTSIATSSV